MEGCCGLGERRSTVRGVEVGQHARACTQARRAHVYRQGAHTRKHTRKHTQAQALLERSHTHTHTFTHTRTRTTGTRGTEHSGILSDARSPSSESESLIHSLSTRSKKFLYEHMLAKLLSCCGRAERSRGQ